MNERDREHAAVDADARAGAGTALPLNRAFVVQFRAGPSATGELPAGRVEHIATGRNHDFDGGPALLRFLGDLIEESEGEHSI